MTEVILLRKLKSAELGSRINVKRGYAVNYLIPNGYAILANKRNSALFEQKVQLIHAKNNEAIANAQRLCKKIEGCAISIHASASDKGRLYSAIDARRIAAELSSICGEKIDHRYVKLKEKIKAIGEHYVDFAPYDNIHVTIFVGVLHEAR